jgi:phage-related protein
MVVNSVIKKIYFSFGAVLVSLLLLSTVTAVPQAHSQPAMDLIDEMEQKETFIERVAQNVDSVDFEQSDGVIDWIIRLLLTILDFIQSLIQFVLDLFQIVSLISTIISAINQLIDAIIQLINSIMDLFTPNMYS